MFFSSFQHVVTSWLEGHRLRKWLLNSCNWSSMYLKSNINIATWWPLQSISIISLSVCATLLVFVQLESLNINNYVIEHCMSRLIGDGYSWTQQCCIDYLLHFDGNEESVCANSDTRQWSQCSKHFNDPKRINDCEIDFIRDSKNKPITFPAHILTTRGLIQFQNVQCQCTNKWTTKFYMFDYSNNIVFRSGSFRKSHLKIDGDWVFAFSKTFGISYKMLLSMHTYGLIHSRTGEPGSYCILSYFAVWIFG